VAARMSGRPVSRLNWSLTWPAVRSWGSGWLSLDPQATRRPTSKLASARVTAARLTPKGYGLRPTAELV
jgi:hypothetical protein